MVVTCNFCKKEVFKTETNPEFHPGDEENWQCVDCHMKEEGVEPTKELRKRYVKKRYVQYMIENNMKPVDPNKTLKDGVLLYGSKTSSSRNSWDRKREGHFKRDREAAARLSGGSGGNHYDEGNNSYYDNSYGSKGGYGSSYGKNSGKGYSSYNDGNYHNSGYNDNYYGSSSQNSGGYFSNSRGYEDSKYYEDSSRQTRKGDNYGGSSNYNSPPRRDGYGSPPSGSQQENMNAYYAGYMAAMYNGAGNKGNQSSSSNSPPMKGTSSSGSYSPPPRPNYPTGFSNIPEESRSNGSNNSGNIKTNNGQNSEPSSPFNASYGYYNSSNLNSATEKLSQDSRSPISNPQNFHDSYGYDPTFNNSQGFNPTTSQNGLQSHHSNGGDRNNLFSNQKTKFPDNNNNYSGTHQLSNSMPNPMSSLNGSSNHSKLTNSGYNQGAFLHNNGADGPRLSPDGDYTVVGPNYVVKETSKGTENEDRENSKISHHSHGSNVNDTFSKNTDHNEIIEAIFGERKSSPKNSETENVNKENRKTAENPENPENTKLLQDYSSPAKLSATTISPNSYYPHESLLSSDFSPMSPLKSRMSPESNYAGSSNFLPRSEIDVNNYKSGYDAYSTSKNSAIQSIQEIMGFNKLPADDIDQMTTRDFSIAGAQFGNLSDHGSAFSPMSSAYAASPISHMSPSGPPPLREKENRSYNTMQQMLAQGEKPSLSSLLGSPLKTPSAAPPVFSRAVSDPPLSTPTNNNFTSGAFFGGFSPRENSDNIFSRFSPKSKNSDLPTSPKDSDSLNKSVNYSASLKDPNQSVMSNTLKTVMSSASSNSQFYASSSTSSIDGETAADKAKRRREKKENKKKDKHNNNNAKNGKNNKNNNNAQAANLQDSAGPGNYEAFSEQSNSKQSRMNFQIEENAYYDLAKLDPDALEEEEIDAILTFIVSKDLELNSWKANLYRTEREIKDSLPNADQFNWKQLLKMHWKVKDVLRVVARMKQIDFKDLSVEMKGPQGVISLAGDNLLLCGDLDSEFGYRVCKIDASDAVMDLKKDLNLDAGMQ